MSFIRAVRDCQILDRCGCEDAADPWLGGAAESPGNPFGLEMLKIGSPVQRETGSRRYSSAVDRLDPSFGFPSSQRCPADPKDLAGVRKQAVGGTKPLDFLGRNDLRTARALGVH